MTDIAWITPAATGWDGPDDSWRQSDQTFELWLLAMVTFRRGHVLAEALDQGKRPEPKPQPKPRPTPTPAPRRHVQSLTDTFTDQQMTKGAEILARIEQNRKTA